MELKMEVATGDAERVLKAFGELLGLGRPATPKEVVQQMGKYVQGVVHMSEQTALIQKANEVAGEIPPVDVGEDPKTIKG